MSELTDFVASKVAVLPASTPAKAYITGLFLDQARAGKAVDLSDRSIVLAHLEARHSMDLSKAQNIADWVMWMLSWFPAHARDHREVVESLGRLNYYRCYRLVPSWRVYEELADNLPVFARQLAVRNAPFMASCGR